MVTEQESCHHDECEEKAHHWVLDKRNFCVCKKRGAKKQFTVEGCQWQRRKVAIGKAKAL